MSKFKLGDKVICKEIPYGGSLTFFRGESGHERHLGKVMEITSDDGTSEPMAAGLWWDEDWLELAGDEE